MLPACGDDDDSGTNDEFVIPTGSTATVRVGGAAAFLDEEELADTANPEYGNSDRAESLRQLEECASAHGVTVDKVKSVGAASTLEMDSDAVLFLKIRDNNSSATVNVEEEPPAATELEDTEEPVKLSAVCIFLHGNKAALTVNLKTKVGKIYYRARGNKSKTTFAVSEGAGADAIDISVTGNKAELALTGLGTAACTTLTANVEGHKTAYTCL